MFYNNITEYSIPNYNNYINNSFMEYATKRIRNREMFNGTEALQGGKIRRKKVMHDRMNKK